MGFQSWSVEPGGTGLLILVQLRCVGNKIAKEIFVKCFVDCGPLSNHCSL